MVIRSCKMYMDVKSNLYASLDIIPESGMNESKQWSKQCSKRTPTLSYQTKMVRNGPKLQKGGKNFQIFSINSKKFKNYISFEIFTHLSSKLPTRIPGASFGEIRHCLFQVTSHVLFHFHVNFFNFHGQFFTFRPVQIGLFGPRENRGFFRVQGWLYVENPPKPTYIRSCFANNRICGRTHGFLGEIMTKNYF